jgi:hypothetical protein
MSRVNTSMVTGNMLAMHRVIEDKSRKRLKTELFRASALPISLPNVILHGIAWIFLKTQYNETGSTPGVGI